MTTKNWWTRVKEWSQNRESEMGATELPADLVLDSPLKAPAEEAKDGEGEATGPLARWMQRRQTAAQLETGLEQLVQGNERLASALEKFTQAAELNARKFDELARNQERFGDLFDRQSKAQEQTLAEIQRLTAVADRFAAALEAVPKSTREQAERLSAIEEHLQSEGQTDRALLASMDTLGRHVAAMARQAETRPAVNPDEVVQILIRQVQPLVDVTREQIRWSKWIAALLAAIGLGLGGILVVLLLT